MVEEEIIAFIRGCLGSVYALELLLLIKRQPSRAWRGSDLVRELRSSATAVGEALNRLVQAGLVREAPEGRYAFAPVSPKHAQLVAAIENAYTGAPMSVIKAIMAAPGDKPDACAGSLRPDE